MIQVTPDLIEQAWQPHKVTFYKENGKYFKMIGKYIEGKNIPLELDILLQNTKEPFTD